MRKEYIGSGLLTTPPERNGFGDISGAVAERRTGLATMFCASSSFSSTFLAEDDVRSSSSAVCERLRDEVTGVLRAEFGTFCFGDSKHDGGTGVSEL